MAAWSTAASQPTSPAKQTPTHGSNRSAGPASPSAPGCGTDRAYLLRPANGIDRKTRSGGRSERRVWKCRRCRRQISALTGTLLHGTCTSSLIWLLVVTDACHNPNRLTVDELSHRYDLSTKTARTMIDHIDQATIQPAKPEDVLRHLLDSPAGSLQRAFRPPRHRQRHPARVIEARPKPVDVRARFARPGLPTRGDDVS